MALESTGQVVGELPVGLITEVGQIALWLQTVGVIIVIWIIVQFIVIYLNRRRMKEIEAIRKDMRRIESKIDKLVKRK